VAARSWRLSGFWLGVVGSLIFLLTAGVAARGRIDARGPDELSPVTFQHYPVAAFALRQGAYRGPESGDVKISVAGKETTVRVEADRTAEVQIAVPDGLRPVPITVESTTRFRPADVNPASDDTRPLGCQVRVSLE
jgi:hypothetical protein